MPNASVLIARKPPPRVQDMWPPSRSISACASVPPGLTTRNAWSATRTDVQHRYGVDVAGGRIEYVREHQDLNPIQRQGRQELMATRSAAEQIASGCISSRFPAASALNDAFPDLRKVTASSGMSSRSSPSTTAITRPSRKIVSIPSTENGSLPRSSRWDRSRLIAQVEPRHEPDEFKPPEPRTRPRDLGQSNFRVRHGPRRSGNPPVGSLVSELKRYRPSIGRFRSRRT